MSERAVLLVASKAALYSGPRENAQGEKRNGEYMDKLWTGLVKVSRHAKVNIHCKT